MDQFEMLIAICMSVGLRAMIKPESPRDAACNAGNPAALIFTIYCVPTCCMERAATGAGL
jgi:hypothetical protein